VDIRDLDAVTAAMEGVDATVHLAGIPHEASFDRILETNVVGRSGRFYGVPAAASRSSRSISSAACRSCAAWKCA
jgi:hypothetical protein